MTWGWYDIILLPVAVVLFSFLRVTFVPLRKGHNEKTPQA